jgi:hypothetical protein
LNGLAMEDVGTFYGHLISFKAVRCILRPFGIFTYGHLVYLPMVIWYIYLWSFGIFPRFGMLHQEHSGNADRRREFEDFARNKWRKNLD